MRLTTIVRAGVLMLTLAGARTAAAQTAVLTSPPDASEVRAVNVAYASSGEQATVWFNARVYGAADELYVVVPMPQGAALDVASDAWFEALANATDPRVLPPEAAAPACEGGHPPQKSDVHVVTNGPREANADVEQPAQLMKFAELVTWLQGADVGLTIDLINAWADLELQGGSFALLRVQPLLGETRLSTLRVTGPAAGLRVPMLLSRVGAASVPLTVWVFGPGRAEARESVGLDGSRLVWDLASEDAAASNYSELRHQALHGSQGWLTEAVTHRGLFRSIPFADATAAVPSIVASYFHAAADLGDTNEPAAACITNVSSLEHSNAKVAPACAEGALLRVPADPGQWSCHEQVEPGQLDPERLRCGAGAGDLALAFSGHAPSQLWVTRWSGEIASWQRRSEETFEWSQPVEQAPLWNSEGYDTQGCGGSGSGAAGGSQGAGGSPGGSGRPPSGNGTVPGSGDPYAPGAPSGDYYEDDEDQRAVELYMEGSCWGDTSTSSGGYADEDESCAGDTTGPLDDSEESCSGDSTDSAEEESCSGDSSDTGGEESCSDDTSSSAGEESCSGDSTDSASSAGDACSSSSGNSDCSLSGAGKRRGLKTSAFVYLLAASYLVARRRQARGLA